MKRPGVLSWNLLHGNPEALARHLLVYDELWVPDLHASIPSEREIRKWDLDRSEISSIQWLVDQGVIVEPPIDLRRSRRDDEIAHDLRRMCDEAHRRATKTYPTARKAALAAGAAMFDMDIALSRLTIYLLWRERQEIAYPVVFPFDEAGFLSKEVAGVQRTLSIVLKRFPTPSTGNLPLEDLLAFKRDPETAHKFARFWHWIWKVSENGTEARSLEEELDFLLAEYSEQVRQLTKQVRHERLEILLSTPGGVLEDVLKLRWGNLGKRLLSLRGKNIAAHREEMKLPGNEIAYVTEASRLLSAKGRLEDPEMRPAGKSLVSSGKGKPRASRRT